MFIASIKRGSNTAKYESLDQKSEFLAARPGFAHREKLD